MHSNLLNSEDKILLKKITKYIKPYKVRYILLLLLLLCQIAFGLIQPLIMGKLADNLLHGNFNMLLKFIIQLSLLNILEMIFDFTKSYGFTYLNNSIVYNLNCDFYKKVINLPIKAFDEMRIGDFISRLNNDSNIIASTITNQFLNAIIDIIRFFALTVMIFKMNTLLALTTIFVFPLLYIIMLVTGKKLKRRNEEIKKINDNYISNIQQSLFAIREVKSLGIKDESLSRFTKFAKQLKSKSIKISITQMFSNISTRFTLYISYVAQLCLGGYLIFRNLLTIDRFFAFTVYSQQFSNSLNNIMNINQSLQVFLVSLRRVYNIMDNITYESEKFGDKHIENFKGNIEFNNVWFGYKKDKPILKGISFKISNNNKIAIIGKSGVGKSTIFNLLLKFYTPNKGNIKIDNIDINDYDEFTLRNNIAVVRQEPFIFNTSIKENLVIVNKNATDDDIIEACKEAYIHDYIINLPNKYETVVGENGINLSGGQKQRIAIARALLKNSKIILLDEATSALDNESQFYIKEALKDISNKRTVIIIAHRLSTIIDADEIYIINEGKIVGKGNHYSLIKDNIFYKELYEKEINMSNGLNAEVS